MLSFRSLFRNFSTLIAITSENISRRAVSGASFRFILGLLISNIIPARANSQDPLIIPKDSLNLLSLIPTSEWSGIKSGLTNYDATAALKKFLSHGGNLFIPDGLYITGPLFIKDSSDIYFSPGVILRARVGFKQNDCVLNINTNNVSIYGNGASIEMLKNEYNSGEWRHCVNLFGAKNVKIFNLRSANSGGDGFYVGGASFNPSIDIILENCIGDNNRRQGLSIVNAINCSVIGGKFMNTVGTAPAAGIDIESNPVPGYFLQNINVTGVQTLNNAGPSIAIVPQYLTTRVSISVTNCKSFYDGGFGWTGALWLSSTIGGAKIDGFIKVRGMKITNPQGSGIVISRWTQDAPDTLLSDIEIVNCASNWVLASKSILSQCAIRLFIEASDTYGKSYGHVNFEDILVNDDRPSVRTYIPIYLRNDTSVVLKNINFSNFYANHWTKKSTVPFEIISKRTENIVVN